MICETLTNAEKLYLCIKSLMHCLYWLKYDLYCGYGERAKECCTDIIETLQTVAPEELKEIQDKVFHNLFDGVDTNAGRSANS